MKIYINPENLFIGKRYVSPGIEQKKCWWIDTYCALAFLGACSSRCRFGKISCPFPEMGLCKKGCRAGRKNCTLQNIRYYVGYLPYIMGYTKQELRKALKKTRHG